MAGAGLRVMPRRSGPLALALTVLTAACGGTHAATVSVFGDRDILGLRVTCAEMLPSSSGTFCDVVARTGRGDGPVKARWTSSRPEVASVANEVLPPSSTMLLLANAPGQTVVTATYGAFQGRTTVDVRR